MLKSILSTIFELLYAKLSDKLQSTEQIMKNSSDPVKLIDYKLLIISYYASRERNRNI